MEAIQPKQVVKAATSKTMAGIALGLTLENLGEKQAFRQFRDVFGVSSFTEQGDIKVYDPKDTAKKADDGLKLRRQLLRGGLALGGLVLTLVSKDELVKSAAFTVAGAAAVHALQDYVPSLR